jgi:tRNA(adenine34) deaminase
MSFSADDEAFMKAALAEANIAARVGEVPVGAVIVRGGDIIGRGLNRPVQDHDPTAHAEIVAIRSAAVSEQNYRLPDTTLYVTLEPCAMCVGAMLHARVSRLVFGAYDPKSGAAGSVIDITAERRFNHSIEVNGGLMEQQCGELLRRFFASRRDPRG